MKFLLPLKAFLAANECAENSDHDLLGNIHISKDGIESSNQYIIYQAKIKEASMPRGVTAEVGELPEHMLIKRSEVIARINRDLDDNFFCLSAETMLIDVDGDEASLIVFDKDGYEKLNVKTKVSYDAYPIISELDSLKKGEHSDTVNIDGELIGDAATILGTDILKMTTNGIGKAVIFESGDGSLDFEARYIVMPML